MSRAFLKVSGELLTYPNAQGPWSPGDVDVACTQIQDVHAHAEKLGLEGMLVVPGGGNIVRGNILRNEFDEKSHVQRVADAVGRMATIQNAVVLSAGLHDLKVPNQVLVAGRMEYSDPSLNGFLEEYSPGMRDQIFDDGGVVVIAGGDGHDGHTTDAAVFSYAASSAAQHPTVEHQILKATKYNGIYDRDPAQDPYATRYRTVGAEFMRMQGTGGLDDDCIRGMAEAPENVTMRVFAASENTPLDVLRDVNVIGTTILPGFSLPRPVGGPVDF